VDLSYIKHPHNRRYRRALLTALSIDPQHPSCAQCGHADHRVLRIKSIPPSPDSRSFRNIYSYYNYVLANPTGYGLICENCNQLAYSNLLNITHSMKAAIRKARLLADPAGTQAMIAQGIDPAAVAYDEARTALRDLQRDLPRRSNGWRPLDEDLRASDSLVDPDEVAADQAATADRADELLESRVAELQEARPGHRGVGEIL
jgi:hypothetical protein